MTRLLSRVFVTRFYRQHAGLLLFLLLACFAAVQASSLVPYHLAIMRAILSAPLVLAVVLLLWLAWYVRALHSGLRLLHLPEGAFLHQLRGLPARRLALLFGAVALQWLAPLLIYAALLAAFGMRNGFVLPALTVLLFHALALTVTIVWICQAINRASVPARFALPGVRRKQRSHLPFVWWPLRQLWAGSRRTYLVVKLFSFALLYIPFVWNGDHYEHDSLPLFLIGLTAANSWSAYRAVRFLEGPARFYRNLPVGTASVAAAYVLTYSVFLLPEGAYLLWVGRSHVAPLQLPGIWMAPLATLLFLTAVQYGNGTARDEFIKVLGGLSFVSLFFFNGEHYWRWSLVLLAIGSFLFVNNRHRFEEDRAP